MAESAKQESITLGKRADKTLATVDDAFTMIRAAACRWGLGDPLTDRVVDRLIRLCDQAAEPVTVRVAPAAIGGPQPLAITVNGVHVLSHCPPPSAGTQGGTR